MILTDEVHLISDTSLDELHSFAQSVGLKREWYQDKKIPHYDITTKRKLNAVLRTGKVSVVSSKTIVTKAIRTNNAKDNGI